MCGSVLVGKSPFGEGVVEVLEGLVGVVREGLVVEVLEGLVGVVLNRLIGVVLKRLTIEILNRLTIEVLNRLTIEVLNRLTTIRTPTRRIIEVIRTGRVHEIGRQFTTYK